MAPANTKSDEEQILDLINIVVEAVPTKDIPAMQAIAHPQGVSVSLFGGNIVDRTIQKHFADLADFPGVPGEKITEGTMAIKVLGNIAVATFASDITSDGKLILYGQTVLTFHKVKLAEEQSEEWKLTVLADSNTPV